MTRQSFAVIGGSHLAQTHIEPLRQAMQRVGIDALYVPHADEYRNEMLPQHSRRLEWISGFSGSAGAALVLADSAHLFVDGRYVTQAQMQTDTDLFDIHDLTNPGPTRWLASNATKNCRIGFDPHLVTPTEHKHLQNAVDAAQADLVKLSIPVLDAAWSDRPSPTIWPVRPHRSVHSGRSATDKCRALVAHLQKQQSDHLVMTSPISIAWTFNIRADGVPRCPAPPGRAIIDADGCARLFLDPQENDGQLRAHLGDRVLLADLDMFPEHLAGLGGNRVSVDPGDAPCWVVDALSGADIVFEPDPSALPRACKNAVELEGARMAHRLDGAALVQFLCWLDGAGEVTEIDAVRRLESFRQDTGVLRDISFDTIAGSGPHGAIIHYRVDESSNRTLRSGELFLVDSGGQYDAATTDVTRTVAIGPAGVEEKHIYTLVLRSHLALSMARFPADTPGIALDAIARAPMWGAGLDYAHGTGHGVGSYLNVHEGPQRIARRGSQQVLLPGMIVSNEPGYYRPGAFGIRIENLQYVTDAASVARGDSDMMGFAVLTLCPYDRSLIEAGGLDQRERACIDSYHARVHNQLSSLVDGATEKWLERACAPLTDGQIA